MEKGISARLSHDLKKGAWLAIGLLFWSPIAAFAGPEVMGPHLEEQGPVLTFEPAAHAPHP